MSQMINPSQGPALRSNDMCDERDGSTETRIAGWRDESALAKAREIQDWPSTHWKRLPQLRHEVCAEKSKFSVLPTGFYNGVFVMPSWPNYSSCFLWGQPPQMLLEYSTAIWNRLCYGAQSGICRYLKAKYLAPKIFVRLGLHGTYKTQLFEYAVKPILLTISTDEC